MTGALIVMALIAAACAIAAIHFAARGYEAQKAADKTANRVDVEDAVRTFHLTYGHPAPIRVGLPAGDIWDLRQKLIAEEWDELADAYDAADPVAFADAIADLIYVVVGAGIEAGIPVNAAFQIVHESNMSKLDDDGFPILRDDGKILKGPNYVAPTPRIESLIAAAASGYPTTARN